MYLNLQKTSLTIKTVPIRGIEPRCVPYERTVLPLNYIGIVFLEGLEPSTFSFVARHSNPVELQEHLGG